ncbi:MAG: PilN domain-containing protein [Myxococcota bacterium]|nr:PilN domain-containing protein [Myxococcota bacterium]
MIGMIRINLLPAKDGRRRRSSGAGGQKTGAILMLLIILELLGMFGWYQDLSDQATEQQAIAKRAEDKVKSLEKKKKRLEDREQSKLELARQNVIFEKMKSEKTGPPEMLKFLSYVLTKKEDNLYNREELKAQEAAGWASGWNPQNLWLTEVVISEEGIVLRGHGRNHEDVAEFYRRLESGIYFIMIDPVFQKVFLDPDFADLELVEFEATAMLNYNTDGELRMTREEVPERLAHLVAAPTAPEPDKKKKKGAKSKKGGH